MQRRYALRFESGERRGETIALDGPALTIGRRPGVGVQILDASVSGRHAELAVDENGVTVRDLGSTNGTRVGAERISERRLAHGDEVLLGNVRMLFIDGAVEAAPPLTAPAPVDTAGLAGSPEAAGDVVHTVSAETLAKSRGGRRSIVTWVVLVALAVAGGGAWWWLRSQGAGTKSAAARAVSPVAGNLLAEGFSFEDEGLTWTAAEPAPMAFGPDSSARRSGETGLSAEVGPDEWAEHLSAAVRAPRGRALEARAWIRAAEGRGRVGVRFEDSTGVAGSVTAWSRAAEVDGDFAPVEVVAPVPGGYDQARAVVRAAPEADGVGVVEVDDVSLVAVDGSDASATVGEYELTVLGDPPGTANLFKIDRVLISDLRVTATRRGAEPVRLDSQAGEKGIRLTPSGGSELALRVESTLAGEGLATTGEGGYRTHQVEFEREGVSAVLLGAGRDLVRLGFEGGARVSGRPAGEAFLLQVSLGEVPAFDLQLSFREELNEGQSLARDAREAEEAEQLGQAIALWTRVLDEYPYEADLLREADASRARLIDAGLGEVREIGLRAERAEFFRLVDLFRLARDGAADIAARYADSEVEAAANELSVKIEADLSVLEADLDRHERARLEAIARQLEASESPKLAARVREYLEQHFASVAGPADAGAAAGGGTD